MGTLPVLTENQHYDLLLLKRIWAGDEAAKETLVRKYLPMVYHLARHRAGEWFEYEDLCQEGAIGLLHAIAEYDPVRFAVKFSTFAYICILRHLNNATRKMRSKKSKLSRQMLSLHQQLGQEEGRSLLDSLVDPRAGPWEVAVENWATERIRMVLAAYLSPVEYAVVELLRQGMATREIQAELAMAPKVVDNARTRARIKILRLLNEYGTILHPAIPLRSKKRPDLAIKLGKKI